MARIAFLGDLALFSNGTLSKDWKSKLSNISRILREYDYVIANLETPITSCNSTLVCKGIHLKTSREIIEVLKYLNIGAVSLANNHICDYGIVGMEDTIAALKEAGIVYYGVNGISADININGEKLKLSGHCCYSANGSNYIKNNRKKGINALTSNFIVNELYEAEQDGRLCVMSLHWGDEYSQLPNERQVKFMHRLSEKYKFILHGHHTHVMQGIEKINDSLIVYSQGNFMFDEVHSDINEMLVIKQSLENKESYIVSVTVENGMITDWCTQGIINGETLELIDNSSKVDSLSDKIKDCSSVKYKEESRMMIASQKIHNLGKKDLRWLISKLNYYSIGAKILWYVNNWLYKRAY